MESRTQGSRPRPRTVLQRTDRLESQHKNARGQFQEPRTQAQVLSKKKRPSEKFIRRSPKQKSFEKNFKRSREKTVFQKIFQTLHKLLTTQKIVLSSNRGQGNFRGQELDFRSQGHGLDFRTQGIRSRKMCPRPHLC